jgi:hypothetical protein
LYPIARWPAVYSLMCCSSELSRLLPQVNPTTTKAVRTIACEACGTQRGTAGLMDVAVCDRRSGERLTLRLCPGCRDGRDRALWLRYRLERGR